MPLFACERCNTVDNTALAHYWGRDEKLCSECGHGEWHGKFEKNDANKYQLNKHGFLERKAVIADMEGGS